MIGRERIEIPIKRRFPAPSGICDWDKAFYPDPPSHDFCVWLVIAELMRRHHKAAGPLKVRLGLIGGQLGMLDFGPLSPWAGMASQCGVSREYSDTMIANVLRPAMAMIGAVEEEAVEAPFDGALLARYVEYDYHVGHLVDAARQGFPVPRFSPPQWAREEVERFLGSERPVVVTLREAEHQPERNSRMLDWLRFGEWLVEGGHPVLFVRDTGKAEEPLPFFPTYPRASRDAFVRAALYERALVNMFVCNGPPCAWCGFGEAPYLMFKQLVPALRGWAHGRPDGWKDQAHMKVGDHWPWASPQQRMTWKDDTFENLRDEFKRFAA